MIPVPLPSPVVCIVTARRPGAILTEKHQAWVAAFTEVDPLGEQPLEDGDGIPLVVTDRGLRTPAQWADDIGATLEEWSLGWPQQGPGGGLVIANGMPGHN